MSKLVWELLRLLANLAVNCLLSWHIGKQFGWAIGWTVFFAMSDLGFIRYAMERD